MEGRVEGGRGRKEWVPVSSGGMKRLGTEEERQYGPFKRAAGSSSNTSSFSIGGLKESRRGGGMREKAKRRDRENRRKGKQLS